MDKGPSLKTKETKSSHSTAMESLIDSDLFAVLAWKSKCRTIKYLFLAMLAFVLNVFCGVSVTVMVLVVIFVRRGPRMALNLRAARKASYSDQAKEERQRLMREQIENEDLELISDEHMT